MDRVTIVVIVFLTISATCGSKISRPPIYREGPINNKDTEVIIDYRLPNNTKPNSYDIHIQTDIDRNKFDFNGTVIINLTVVNDTRTIVLHKRQIDILSAKLSNSTNEIDLLREYEETREFLKLTPTDSSVNLLRGQTYNLTINYSGVLREDNKGFYRSTYTNSDNKTVYLATTQFESTDARHGFPCYDEPAIKANVTISIKHGPSYTAISNMPVDENKSIEGLTVFKTSPKMSTYLVAFIVSEFNSTSGTLKELSQRVFSRSGTEDDQDFALISALQITDCLSEYFGVPFSLPKLDQVAVPDFAAGAMENWGLVTYREEYLLYNRLKSSVNTQTSVFNVIGHEYTHQWFGNLVTPKWWTFLWLKEGFATMFSYVSDDLVYPEWDIMQNFFIDEYQRALANDAGEVQRPMTHYVQEPSEIGELYDAISYSKAGSVLVMWQNALTDTVFRRGLNIYLNNKNFDAAEEDDLFEAFRIAAKENNMPIYATINEMMKSWTNQGGYPLLHVERNYDNGTFLIKQQPFYTSTSVSSSKLWYIPYNFASTKHSDFRNTTPHGYLKKEKQVQVTANVDKDEWLILNKRSTGYYRVNYDSKNWQLIINGLKTKHHKIHPHNRASLMFDAHALSSSGLLNHDVLLNMLQYLINEEEYAPWSTANTILTSISRYLSSDEYYSTYTDFIRTLVSNIYDKLGVSDVPGEHRLRKYTRTIAINLACLAEDDDCLTDTKDKLNEFVTKNVEIEPNLQTSIYCNGLKQASDQVFNFMYTFLMRSNDQAQRRILISSLGCAKNQTHLKKLIESSINTDENVTLRTQERTTVLRSAYSRGEVGLLSSIEFLMDNYNEYAELTSSFGKTNPLDDDIRGMSTYVVTDNQKNKLTELVQKVKDHPKVTPTLEKDVASSIQRNFDWLDHNKKPITNWLVLLTSGAGSSDFGTARMISIFVSLTVIVKFMY